MLPSGNRVGAGERDARRDEVGQVVGGDDASVGVEADVELVETELVADRGDTVAVLLDMGEPPNEGRRRLRRDALRVGATVRVPVHVAYGEVSFKHVRAPG